MLVLTRRVGQTIVIDGNIRVSVVAVQGGKIRIGVAAPDSVCVDREEVHERRLHEIPRHASYEYTGALSEEGLTCSA